MRRGLAARANQIQARLPETPKFLPARGREDPNTSSTFSYIVMSACSEPTLSSVPDTPPRLKSPKLPPSNGGDSKASSANRKLLPKAVPACLESPPPLVPRTASPSASPQPLKLPRLKSPKLPPSNEGDSKASSANRKLLPKAVPACLESPPSAL